MSAAIENQLCVLRLDSIYTTAITAEKPECDEKVSELFRVKCRDLELIKETFLRTYVEMEAKAGKAFDSEAHHTNMDSFMDKYYSVKVCYENLFGCDPSHQTNKNETEAKLEHSHVDCNQRSNFQLPKIKLPKFTGILTEWVNFKAIYQSLIHENDSLAPVQKMHYLISSLGGEALNVIKHLPITDSNYPVAHGLVLDRFDNQRSIADTHLDLILDLPLLQSKGNHNLRKFVDTLKENMLALEAQKMPVKHWSFILLNIMLRKLDQQLRNDFELHVKGIAMPQMGDFLDFLESRCKAFEKSTSHVQNSTINTPSPRYFVSSKPVQKMGFLSTITKNCICCNDDGHELFGCQRFLNMLPYNRKEFVSANRLCFNCLGPHTSKRCLSKHVCKYCSGFHNTLLHLHRENSDTHNTTQGKYHSPNFQGNLHKENLHQGNLHKGNLHQGNLQKGNLHQGNLQQGNQGKSSSYGQGQGSTEFSAHSSTLQSNNHLHSTVLLSTALIHVRNGSGEWSEVRALIDPGSQCSFITNNCAKRLRLCVTKDSFTVTALGGQQVQRTDGWISCEIKPRFSEGPTFNTTACVMQNLTKDLPSSYIPEGIAHQFQGLVLADPTFHIKGKIDFLIGADLYDSILLNSAPIKLQPDLPSALQTKLGFILMGRMNIGKEGASSSRDIQSFHGLCENTLDQNIVRFWEIEEGPSSKRETLSSEDAYCEEHFLTTYSRDETGRFSVQLPFKNNAQCLGESKGIALRRFQSLERRLNRDEVLREMYRKFLKEYEELGHMSLVPNPEIDPALYIIPHHGVLRLSSSTTKLRVVFDGSAATTNGTSLNEILLSGPKLQQNIVDILTRFRVHKIVFTSDVKQMYRQINIQENHRPYQRIYWRYSDKEPIQEYQLNTVTYGIKTAPFLAMRCLRKLAEDSSEQYAEASRVVMQDVFVDDVVSGASSLSAALQLKDDLISLLKSGGFELRKWCSNSKDFMATLPSEHCEVPLEYDIDGDTIIKILGLKWNSEDDNFLYTANIDTDVYTKRSLLSNIARLYDPCGWLAPVVFKAKSMMQGLWLLQLDWDQAPPPEFIIDWKLFAGSFAALRGVAIPRYILTGSGRDFQIHAFSDASEKGYAGVVYLRVTDDTGSTRVFLLLAKSKVAPIKQRLTIPKLELNGALLAASLVKYVKGVLSMIDFSSVNIWCDSTIVLSWLCSSPHSLRMYEGNRVSQIHNLVDPSVWRYVPTGMNPADAASRGLYPDQLVSHKLWWDLPWLAEAPQTWPQRRDLAGSKVESAVCQNEAESSRSGSNMEKEAVNCLVGTCDETNSLLVRYSSLSRLLRITSLCLRFIHNCRNKKVDRRHGYITSEELNTAMTIWIKETQRMAFQQEITLISSNKCCKSGIDRLSPFMDKNGILRAGGRLRNSSLAYDSKHPILLPRTHHFTNLIVDDYHIRYLHVGPSTLLSMIRQRFWILSGRQVVRHRVFKCLRCFKNRPRSTDPFMGDLPSGRVQPSKAFSSVAADFAGPFYVKESNLRKARVNKAYLCIFVCFSTKACHLELVSDLSTDAFMACFHRFTSRRGLCRDIHTDNGTNYQGACNHLKEVYQYLAKRENLDKINSELATHQVRWHFGPASAPHFNGLAESAVKSAKHHILRVVGEQRLTFEELSTLLCRVEAILNSRPLFQMSSDPNELQPLTPGHFLVGGPLNSLPEYDYSDVKVNRLSRWQLIQKMTQGFWKQWSNEYLHTLQQRNKWTDPNNNLKVNDLVLIKEDNTSPLQWKLGRVLTLHPGKDSTVRVVTVKTQNGTLVRPVVKLCLLPQ